MGLVSLQVFIIFIGNLIIAKVLRVYLHQRIFIYSLLSILALALTYNN